MENLKSKHFKLLDYTACVVYDRKQHYPFVVNLRRVTDNVEVHVGSYISIEQLCYMTHLEMLDRQYHALNPVKTLFAVERMRDGLDLWMDKLGE